MYGAIYMACMRKTTIYLDDHLYRTVCRCAEAAGRTQASVIREAILAYTAGPARLRSIGLGKSGRGDLSERAEDLLRGMGEER